MLFCAKSSNQPTGDSDSANLLKSSCMIKHQCFAAGGKQRPVMKNEAKADVP